jgi:hypothetical protein
LGATLSLSIPGAKLALLEWNLHIGQRQFASRNCIGEVQRSSGGNVRLARENCLAKIIFAVYVINASIAAEEFTWFTSLEKPPIETLGIPASYFPRMGWKSFNEEGNSTYVGLG